MTAKLSEQLWWTEADAAELDLVAHELVRRVFEHKPTCDVCVVGYPPCPKVGDAIQSALDWRAGRVLRSKASALRLRQSLREFETFGNGHPLEAAA